MEKRKRKVCFLLTVFGVIIMITIQVIIMVTDEMEYKKINYIKTNVVLATKKCVEDGKCKGDNVTFLKLIEDEYITGYFVYDLSDYSSNSYVDIPSYQVNLIIKEDN